MRKFILLLIIFFLVSTLFVSSVLAEEKMYYFISHQAPTEPFWSAVEKGWSDAIALLPGVKGEFAAPQWGHANVPEMLGVIESALASNPDGLAVVMSNPQMLDDPVRTAINNGISIVAVNTIDPRPEGERIPYKTYIGENSYEMGKLAANTVIEKFKEIYGRAPKGAIFLNHAPGVVCMELRGNGVKDACKEHGVEKIEVVEVQYDPGKVIETVRAYTTKYKDTEIVITGASMVSHFSAVSLKENNKLGNINQPAKEGNVFVGGIDVNPDLLKDIMNGDVVCTVDQQPYTQGFMAAIALYLDDTLKIAPVGNINTGPNLILEHNAADILEQAEKGYRG